MVLYGSAVTTAPKAPGAPLKSRRRRPRSWRGSAVTPIRSDDRASNLSTLKWAVRFVNDGAVGVANVEPALLRRHRERLARLLETFAHVGRVVVRLVAAKGDSLELEFRKGKPSGIVYVRTSGTSDWNLAGAFDVRVALALASPDGARLRRCLDHKCNRFFLRRGRGESCTRACSRRVYMRRFRALQRERNEQMRRELKKLKKSATGGRV